MYEHTMIICEHHYACLKTVLCLCLGSSLLTWSMQPEAPNADPPSFELPLLLFLFFQILGIYKTYPLIQCILTTVPLSTPLPATATFPLIPVDSSFISFQKGQDSHGYHPNIAFQVAIRLGTLPHIKARKDNQL